MNDERTLESIAKLSGISIQRQYAYDSRVRGTASYYMNEEGKVTSLNLAGALVGLQVPRQVGNLVNLRSLRLSGNRIWELPDDLFEKLDSLEILGLNGNALNELPSSIHSLTKLQILKLNGNDYRELPTDLRYLTSLGGLFIGSNPLSQLPEWISSLAALEELDLSHTNIVGLPAALISLSKLRTLGLSRTKVSDAALLSYMPNLRCLDLSLTSIIDLPESSQWWEKLEVLNISSTNLESLPAAISYSDSLEVFQAANLGINSLPEEFFALTKLTTINLNGTHIKWIPDSIGNLRSLERIDFGGMGLTYVPPQLFTLPRLTYLNLAGNRLRELPTQVVAPDLRWIAAEDREANGLHLRENPFENPPLEVVMKGREAVATYFRSFKGASRAIDEVKVMLVGDGGSGKTSLMNRLVGREFDPNERQTHGINIDNYSVAYANRRLTVHIWDFGGQEIMHATHQFFLSKRSAYVLVLDGRREEKTEYWLKHVEAFGGDSPVIVVINKIDENPSFDLNRRFLGEKYKGIRAFVRVSCASQEGIADFERMLSATLARLDHATTVWPSSWFNIKERVELLKDDFISSSKYEAMCDEAGIVDLSEREALIEFLHDLGIALRFGDLPLRDTNVINPRWLTQGVYRIVNFSEVIKSGGVLDISQLAQLLPRTTYPPDKHNFIVEIMKKFELCYQLDSGHILLPALLPIEEPSIKVDDRPSVRFIVEYDFLPKSVIARLIVRMHREIENGLQWRSGVVLANQPSGVRAVIRQDEAERKIQIIVSGEQRKEYLGVIAHALREINDSFEKIEAVEKVPMPDRPDVAVTYKHLLTLEARGIRNYIPDGTEREYDVQELLGYVKPAVRTEDEILKVLHQLLEHGDTHETLAAKANKALMLQPNFFGLGINLNSLIERVVNRNKDKLESSGGQGS